MRERIEVIENRLNEIENHFSIKATKDNMRVFRRARDVEPDVFVIMSEDHGEFLFLFSGDSEAVADHLFTVWNDKLLF